MANNCGSLLATGLSSCNSRIQNIAGLVISQKGTTYTSAELATTAKLKTNLSASAGIIAMYLPLSGFNSTTEAPKIETSNLGTKDIFDNQVPSAEAFLDRSFNDYKHLWESNNSIVDVELFTKDGYRVMTSSTTGVYKGFRAKIYCPPGLPKTDNAQEAHPIYIFFTDVSEFQRMVVLSMPFTKTDVEDLVPIGLDVRAAGSYTAGDVSVLATLRGTDTGKAGLDTWTVISSKAADVAVTVDVDEGAGYYTLTIKKDAGGTPANLVSGDITVIQGTKVVTSYVTYITNALEIRP